MTNVVNIMSADANKAVFRFSKITESSSMHLYWMNRVVLASNLHVSVI
jgi:hypothetical protein